MNWAGCKILSLFPGIQHSVKQKINTTYLLSNVSVLNLVSPQTPIFGLQEATIMASVVFLNISPTQVTPKHLSNIHPSTSARLYSFNQSFIVTHPLLWNSSQKFWYSSCDIVIPPFRDE